VNYQAMTRSGTAAVVLFVAMTGCTRPLANEVGPAQMADHVLSPATQPLMINPFSNLSPLRAGTWEYKYVDDKHNDEACTFRLEPGENGIWERHAPQIKHVRFVSSDGKGGILLHKVEDQGRNAITFFEKPLVVYTPDLKPNEPLTTTTHARVTRFKTPDKDLDSGTSSMTITLDGEQRIKTPAGEFDTMRIKMEFKSMFKMAEVSSVAWVYYADGVGIVAEDYSETGRALVFPWFKSRTILLVDYPKP